MWNIINPKQRVIFWLWSKINKTKWVWIELLKYCQSFSFQYGLLVNLFLIHMVVSPRRMDWFCSFILERDPVSISYWRKSRSSTSSSVFNLCFSRISNSVITWFKVLTWTLVASVPTIAIAAIAIYLNMFLLIKL